MRPAAARRGWTPSPPGTAPPTTTPSGCGAGCQASGAGDRASGVASRMTASNSVPDTPSTMQWCVLDTIAQRSPSTPSTIQISHSGLDRSSCWDMMRPTSRRSSSSAPRRRQRGVADVVLDVEVRVVLPQRSPEVRRHPPHDLAVARHEGELGRHHRREVPIPGRRAGEDADRADVHVRDRVLNVQERGVERTQTVGHRLHGSAGRSPPPWLPRRRRRGSRGRRRRGPGPPPYPRARGAAALAPGFSRRSWRAPRRGRVAGPGTGPSPPGRPVPGGGRARLSGCTPRSRPASASGRPRWSTMNEDP